jgi:glucosamine--fructose-6-phosphate aminotransferase (isomerizing)
MYLGSDAIALAPFTDTISYLEEGDWAVVRRNGVEVHDVTGASVARAVQKSNASAFLVDKGNHRHFMAKEIHEQPRWSATRLRTISTCPRAGADAGAAVRFSARSTAFRFQPAAPTYYAGLVAKYWFERFARLPVEIDVASEFRYREAPFSPGGLGDLGVAVGRDR